MSLDHQRPNLPPPYSQSPIPSSSLKLPPLPIGDISDGPIQLPPIDHLTPKPTSNLDLENVTRSSSTQPLHTPAGTVLQPLNLSSLSSRDSAAGSRSAEPSSATMSIDDPSRKRDQSVSMDDPDDRMAAEALCGLGKVSSTRSERSPSGYDTPLQYYPIDTEQIRPTTSHAESEPILSLLTSTHPWLAGTINHSLSAYSSTKSYSPRFIQYGADFVERNIGSPMANTVGSVGRKTGVEGSLRRYLGARRSSELDRIDPDILGDEGSNKRPRTSINSDEMDVEHNRDLKRTSSGHTSIDTLPVYDDNRSPAYESRDLVASDRSDAHAQRQKILPVARSWSTQLMISTSGLGAALNEASLRSLKYCLTILRSANTHVTNLMEALKRLLSDYNNGRSSNQNLEEGMADGELQLDSTSAARSPTSIAERIQRLNTEIWQTLKNVVNTVSRHTGGALPENASVVVRWQLMSVPRRWQRAVSSSRPSQTSEGGVSAEQEAVGNAHRMLAFAIEGIDMMEQVSGVVDSTIISAESWLESMGKKKKTEDQQVIPAPAADGIQQDSTGDVSMTDTRDTTHSDDDKEMDMDSSTT